VKPVEGAGEDGEKNGSEGVKPALGLNPLSLRFFLFPAPCGQCDRLAKKKKGQ